MTMLVRFKQAYKGYGVGQTVAVDEAEGAQLVEDGVAYDTMAPVHRTSDLNPDIKHDTGPGGTAPWSASTNPVVVGSGQQLVSLHESNTGALSTTGSAIPAEEPPPSGSTVGEEATDSAAAPKEEGTTQGQSTELESAGTADRTEVNDQP